MPRYNPAPNWPPPPQGWTPPPGWQPDPAWGPAPEGWQVWVDEPVDLRPNRQTWWRSAVVGAIGAALVSVITVFVATDPARAVGAVVGTFLIPAATSSVWSMLSKRPWGWGRHVVTVLGLFFVLRVISLAGTVGQASS